jgi:hypothetical protein
MIYVTEFRVTWHHFIMLWLDPYRNTDMNAVRNVTEHVVLRPAAALITRISFLILRAVDVPVQCRWIEILGIGVLRMQQHKSPRTKKQASI